jgi:hypothetical protein
MGTISWPARPPADGRGDLADRFLLHEREAPDALGGALEEAAIRLGEPRESLLQRVFPVDPRLALARVAEPRRVLHDGLPPARPHVVDDVRGHREGHVVERLHAERGDVGGVDRSQDQDSVSFFDVGGGPLSGSRIPR